jgi:excisionase family DNA binding protein
MDTLYTVRQVQEILKVDRITIYRMLQDGRLKGMKIGQQWRFAQAEVQRLLQGDGSIQSQPAPALQADAGFPTHCVQTIQNLFSEISLLPGFTVGLEGELLTEISKPSNLMLHMLSTLPGREGCRDGWKAMVRESATRSGILQSRDGFLFAVAPVRDTDAHIGAFFTGQFYTYKPDPYEEAERVEKLAKMYHLDASVLQEDFRQTPVISAERHPQVETWVRAASHAIESILKERTGFLVRLQQIADLTQIH